MLKVEENERCKALDNYQSGASPFIVHSFTLIRIDPRRSRNYALRRQIRSNDVEGGFDGKFCVAMQTAVLLPSRPMLCLILSHGRKLHLQQLPAGHGHGRSRISNGASLGAEPAEKISPVAHPSFPPSDAFFNPETSTLGLTAPAALFTLPCQCKSPEHLVNGVPLYPLYLCSSLRLPFHLALVCPESLHSVTSPYDLHAPRPFVLELD